MYPRFVQSRIARAVSDTRVVMLAGPRQAGKTTLARQLSGVRVPFLSLDNATTRTAALSDPVGFIRELDGAVIDEVQRAPDLLLAIKESVDTDQRPGRFLLTGSANIMTLPRVADSLAGRMKVIRLLPLAQSELLGAASTFLETVFSGTAPNARNTIVGPDLVEVVLSGGYPEALRQQTANRRQEWYLDYIDAVVQRDVRDVAHVEQLQQMPRLLRALGQHTGQLVNYSAIGGGLGLNHMTTRKYTGILEQLFLVRTVQPWFSSVLKRLVKTPKLHFMDAGLVAALNDVTLDRVLADRSLFGALLETFVFSELQKLATWYTDRLEFSHFRDRDGSEVDIVLSNRRDEIVGIEVKASATITPTAFNGLRKLADASGKRFVMGIVLYDHDQVVPFGNRMFAVPVSALWG